MQRMKNVILCECEFIGSKKTLTRTVKAYHKVLSARLNALALSFSSFSPSLSLHRRNSVPDAKFSISGFRYQNLSKEISLSLCCDRCIASQRQKVSKRTIERNRRGWKEWGGTSQRKIVSIMQRNTSQYLILLHFFLQNVHVPLKCTE